MSDQGAFAVHVNQFDGPLELLLHLIKQSKMSIYDIQIEAITKQYVDYLDQMKALNIDLVGEYFVMASNLMAIKSKLLLPTVVDPDDEDVDPRNELVNQLIVYQVYKQHAGDLKRRYVDRAKLHSRAELIPNYANGLIDTSAPLDTELLTNAFQKIVRNRQIEFDDSVTVNEWQYSVAEQTEWLLDRLDHAKQLALSDIFNQQANLEALITTFLALLEMVKQHQAMVQETNSNGVILKRLGDYDEQ
ncbi:ScpA family protein [Lactobacillus sp. Sy-1]|uniref:segregation and condensation protein A n=1 Tax=Lactobacillus sp. Sy-1 TaxID=2109645 RepID=UPI001C59EF63|nr:segregation/condensation protein A [Lactobacillus sp. Sy-1]MBW1605541.1 segregation/condensation protein A [Lactobacillus sp. Sy-1]